MQQDKIICIFGGAGFLGRYITQELARAGYRIKIATRIPESAFELKTCGNVGQIASFQCNYSDPKSIESAVAGCYGVVNLVGILFEKGKNNFIRAHVDIPTMISQACQKAGVKKFIHVSALGIEQSKSKYAKSKLAGEKSIKKEFPNVTILRPSVVFGPGDSFFNMFAKLAMILPALPLIGGGKTKFQPVYVGDIADAVGIIMQEQKNIYNGQTYHLGGPEIFTFKEIYQILLTEINRDRAFIPVPWVVAKIQGAVCGLLPKPLLTMDQVTLLKTDNVVPEGVKTLVDIGIEPTAMEIILPQYLVCYKKGGRLGNKKTA